MMREIFVFSGTGNSLAAAGVLAETLGDCRILSIAQAMEPGPPAARAASVVLVFPLYFFGLPRVVLEFIEKADLSGVSRLFAVVTRGGTPGCVEHLIGRALDMRVRPRDRALGARAPILAGVFTVTFWTNFIVRYRAPSVRRREAVAMRADAKLMRIAREIEAREEAPPRRARGFAPLRPLFLSRYRRFLAEAGASDSAFYATDRCSSCGLCARLCPVSNIRMTGGKPSWLHRCELCLACLHFCPEAAIEYGRKTRGKRRCVHPRVRAEDLVMLNKGPDREKT